MKTPATLLLVAAGISLAACDNARTNTAYNNSGASATPAASVSTAPDAYSTGAPASAPPAAGASQPVASGATDETLASVKIMTALSADDTLKGSDISVATANGVVTLSGTAKTQEQVAMATSIAQKQEGVTRVETTVGVQ